MTPSHSQACAEIQQLAKAWALASLFEGEAIGRGESDTTDESEDAAAAKAAFTRALAAQQELVERLLMERDAATDSTAQCLEALADLEAENKRLADEVHRCRTLFEPWRLEPQQSLMPQAAQEKPND